MVLESKDESPGYLNVVNKIDSSSLTDMEAKLSDLSADPISPEKVSWQNALTVKNKNIQLITVG
jgi:hypothetical protein